MASRNNEAGDFMATPAGGWRIALDPKFGDLAVNGVRDLAKRIGAAQLCHAVRLVHDLHVHATVAMPGNEGQHKFALSA